MAAEGSVSTAGQPCSLEPTRCHIGGGRVCVGGVTTQKRGEERRGEGMRGTHRVRFGVRTVGRGVRRTDGPLFLTLYMHHKYVIPVGGV
jgi:hypothetical protein